MHIYVHTTTHNNFVYLGIHAKVLQVMPELADISRFNPRLL